MSMVAVATLTASAPDATAQLYFYEPFDYADGSNILGQNGGTGFTTPWGLQSGTLSGQAFTAVGGSLAGPAGLPTLGGHAFLTGQFGTLQARRSFANVLGSDGTTTWYSFIGQRQGPTGTNLPDNPYGRGVNIGLFDTEATANAARQERIGVGNNSNAALNEWALFAEGQGGAGFRAGSGVPYNELHWAVVKIVHHGDHTVADDVYLWLDPDPNVEPAEGAALASLIGAYDYSNLDFLRPFVGNTSGGNTYGELLVDEIRLGGDYASMSAVPEPSALALLGIGALSFFVRRRQTR